MEEFINPELTENREVGGGCGRTPRGQNVNLHQQEKPWSRSVTLPWVCVCVCVCFRSASVYFLLEKKSEIVHNNVYVYLKEPKETRSVR